MWEGGIPWVKHLIQEVNFTQIADKVDKFHSLFWENVTFHGAVQKMRNPMEILKKYVYKLMWILEIMHDFACRISEISKYHRGFTQGPW